MASKDCNTCPAYGRRTGETWSCNHCGETFRWDGSKWVFQGKT